MWDTGYAKKQLEAKRIILRRLTKSKTRGQIVTGGRHDPAGEPLWFGGVPGRTGNPASGPSSPSLLLRVIFGALTSLTDAVTCG